MLAAERGGLASCRAPLLKTCWKRYVGDMPSVLPLGHLVERELALKRERGEYALTSTGRERAELLADKLAAGEPLPARPPRGPELAAAEQAKTRAAAEREEQERQRHLRPTRSRFLAERPRASWSASDRKRYAALPSFELDDDVLWEHDHTSEIPTGTLTVGFHGTGAPDQEMLGEIERMFLKIGNEFNWGNDIICEIGSQVVVPVALAYLLVEEANYRWNNAHQRLIVVSSRRDVRDLLSQCDREQVLDVYEERSEAEAALAAEAASEAGPASR
jgi:hypothetical protein